MTRVHWAGLSMRRDQLGQAPCCSHQLDRLDRLSQLAPPNLLAHRRPWGLDRQLALGHQYGLLQ